MNALEDVGLNAFDVLKSGAFFRQNVSGSQAGNKRSSRDIEGFFARKRLGRCRMTCSSCESVQQKAGSNICSQEWLL